MTDIIIREVQESDYINLLSLINNELGYPGLTLEILTVKISEMKKAGNYFIFVASVNNEAVGFISAIQEITLEMQSSYFRIIGLAVSKANQGKGIGSMLLNYMEQFASDRGVCYFTLSSGLQRLDAHAFYEHNGYVKKSFSFQKGQKDCNS